MNKLNKMKKYLLLASIASLATTENVKAENNKFDLTAGVSSILKNNFKENEEFNLTAGVGSILKNIIQISVKQHINYDITSPDYNLVKLSYKEEPTDHFNYIESNHGKDIENISNTYGIDPLLYKALLSREYGIENGNLARIQRDIWINQTITAYNFDLGEYETLLIDNSCFRNFYNNIKTGAMILQNEMYTLDGNILAGLQGYNYGGITTKNLIKKYATNHDLDVEDILNEQDNIDWIKYIEQNKIENYGDSYYIDHVLAHIHEEDYTLTLKMIDGTTEYVTIEKEKVLTK